MRTYNKQVQTAVLLNTNITGPAIPLKNIFMFSIAANITGTPTGAVKLQASNDPETNDTQPDGTPQPTPTHWADISNTSTSVSAAGTTLYSISDVAYNYVRVIYTDTSGGASTATMSVVINAKGV